MDRHEREELVAVPHRTLAVVNEALALRRSHPHAPAVDVLDLVIRGRDVWLEDFLDPMVPPSPFALLVAEAVGDCMTAGEWRGLTGLDADPRVRDALVQMYREAVWPKFVGRYGFSYPAPEPEKPVSGWARWL
jgi:hypothetical protein